MTALTMLLLFSVLGSVAWLALSVVMACMHGDKPITKDNDR
jgi:hypothetical protein